MDESLGIETQDEHAAYSDAMDQFVVGRTEQGIANLDLATAALRFGWVASRNWHRERNEAEIEAAADRLREALRRREQD